LLRIWSFPKSVNYKMKDADFDRTFYFFIFITSRTKVMKNNPPLAEEIQTFVYMRYLDPVNHV
jgi:hypothetical protein